ncbi:MAG: peptidylprolyl isomerase [Pseudomonadota bacterium]
MRRLGFLAFITLISGLLSSADMVRAQGQFSPELQVGGSIITTYQIDQRTRFLTLLGAPGDIRNLAREQLINETLQLGAARDQGVEVTPEAIEEGITQFAARANLTAEQFLTITNERGISAATVRDFFTAGVAWRDTVRDRFGTEIRASVSEDDSRRALALTGTEGGLRVLVSEIILPAATPETARASQTRAAELSRLTDEAAFSAAARQFSVAPSSNRGGELDWVAVDSLPDAVRPTIEALSPGQVSRPVALENAVGVFLLRDEERVSAGAPDALSIDYALFTVAGGRTEAALVAAKVDVCDDFYGVAKGLPENRLTRETRPLTSLPADMRAAIDTMDEGETSTALTRGGNATVLMLCQRQPDQLNTVDLTIAGNRLLNVRLGTTAAHYLAQLRANADIVEFNTN